MKISPGIHFCVAKTSKLASIPAVPAVMNTSFENNQDTNATTITLEQYSIKHVK